MESSAGIRATFGVPATREQRRDTYQRALGMAAGLAAMATLLWCTVSVALLSAEANAIAECDAERERAGLGRAAAQRAMEAPERQHRFLYRVATDDEGYLVRLMVRAGPFVGDTWERDTFGRMHHAHDVCRERLHDEIGARLLARLEDS
ncbi:MAG: hypothetical protein IT383_03385 [Deltaproteobacteria bacterium]|nr:hypothetical protein [Deltaproteobacteria bacterium]